MDLKPGAGPGTVESRFSLVAERLVGPEVTTEPKSFSPVFNVVEGRDPLLEFKTIVKIKLPIFI